MSPVRIAFADVEDDRVIAAVAALEKVSGVTPVYADSVVAAAEMVRDGTADAGVAGSITSSPDCIRAALKTIGTAQPGGFACGCFFMHLGDKVLTYADPAFVPQPDSEQLAAIAIEGADAHHRLTGEEPLVAMLSFSTLGSAEHPDVTKVRDAVKLVRDRRPDIKVDGEFQFDVAVDAAVAARKCPESPVAGNANGFVFPDLDAGNIAYKITERLAGARAIGSFVLGLRRPWVDLSRGCSVDDIVGAANAIVRLAQQQEKVPA
jgi:phosphate acetyltransferase